MLDETTPTTEAEGAETAPATKAPAKKAPAKKAAAKKAPAKKAATKAPAKAGTDADVAPAAEKAPAKKAAAKRAPAKKAAAPKKQAEPAPVLAEDEDEEATEAVETTEAVEAKPAARAVPPTLVLFQAPEPVTAPRRRQPAKAKPVVEEEVAEAADETVEEPQEPQAPRAPRAPRTPKAPRPEQQDAEPTGNDDADNDENDDDDDEAASAARRRRRRGGRRRRKPSDGENEGSEASEDDESEDDAESDDSEGGNSTKRRRVRVRDGEGRQSGGQGDDANTVTRVRPSRTGEDQITSISGSTRLEAKKQRRRDGREAGRRRAPIVSEAEFLARREAVDRVMVIRQREDLTQIAVLEDKVLVEHYVARESQTSLIGNVYLGRVQNVLPSMEAAFIDIGKGRNAVLYAGEVNWSALGHRDGQARKIESVLSSGQQVLVQVTKDPVGHKGARLTSQVSLAGRFLVYVPDGTTSGISRKLPDTERSRLKALLKEIVPDTAGVIVRTAAEGASEEELTHDVERLKSRWEEIEKQSKGNNPGPKLLYGEPDLTLKVVRDLFTEDFAKLVIQGKDAWETVQGYVRDVAPDLEERLERYDAETDVFATYRIDEQIAKGLDRKVWLPSGGSLIIDRTEAMTVVDVNTGKFTGSGGNLEETVTKNNLEAAEEMVRQLRLRDIGGIIVVDFIDMVLESNRDLVLRRLVECLGRDRTRHQVAEVTSLGLVQMTRKRIGTGLVEAFSENCEHCQGRGVVIHDQPIEARGGVSGAEEPRRGGRRNRGGRGGQGDQPRQDGARSDAPQGDAPKGESPKGEAPKTPATPPTPKDVAAVARPDATPVVEVDDEGLTVDGAAPVPEPTEAAVVEAPVEAAVVEAPAVETAPVEPAAPKVITRTRRAASRPAGSTAGTTAPAAIVVPDAPVVVVEHTPVVEPPKVVTRTRKVATRPAGAGTASTAAPAAAEAPQDAPAPVDAPADEESEPVELHVPIKKKGARKR